MKQNRRLLKKIFVIGLGATLLSGIGITANRAIEEVSAAEAVYHSTSFSASDGFSISTTYNAPRTNQGNSPYLWDFLNGTVSTTNAITSPSAHLRGYAGQQTQSLETVFAVPNITKVVFSYKSDTNISVNLSYSTNGRSSWSAATNYARSSSATQVTYTINANGLAGNTNVRWQMQNAGTATGGSAELIIDDVTIYYMAGEAVDVTGVSISEGTSLNLYEGETQQLTAVVEPANATEKGVSWSSNNPSKASVDSSGLVSALSVGSAIITVTTDDGGFTDSITINVLADPFMEAAKSSFNSSGSALWGQSEGFGAYFSTGYGIQDAEDGGYVKNHASISVLASAPLGSDIKVVVGAVTNNASNTCDVTVYGLDSSGNRISGLNGSFITHNQSISTVGAGHSISLANPRQVILSTPSDKRVERIEVVFASALSKTFLSYIDIYVESYEAATLTSIAITTNPTKTAYYEGEVFNPSGMVVTATYSDSSSKAVEGYTYSTEPLEAGTTQLEISYTELEITKTANVSISVTAVVLNSISIKTPASTTSFKLGQLFSYSGLVINANYNSGTIEISSGFTVTGVNTKVLGSQTALITFEGKTASYTVDVTNQGASVGTSLTMSDLIISEYIEGSSFNKAIEIYNGTGSSVDLSAYKLHQYNNESSEISYTLALEGTLANGDVFVAAHSSANQTIKDVADLESGSSVLNFNGNDAISLSNNDVEIDIVGPIGSAADFAKDVTLVRKSSISSPTMSYSADDWDSYATDTFSNLGFHTTGGGDVTPNEQATAFANYVMTGIGNNARGNCEAVLDELETEYAYMHADAKSIFSTSSNTLFIDARARMAYLTNWVNALGQGSGEIQNPSTAKRSSLVSVAIISLISVSVLSGYYFLHKKKEII
jgi:uncharacterized protein YjdB